MAESLIEKIRGLKKQKLSNQTIIGKLIDEGYPIREIDTSLKQIELQEGLGDGGKEEEYQRTIDDDLELKAPSPSGEMKESALTREEEGAEYVEEEEVSRPAEHEQANYREQRQPSIMRDQIAALVEAVIDERWGQVVENMGDLISWREKISDDITSIKQEILRVQERFDRLQNSLYGKVEEYNKNIGEVGSEIKALEKVFEKIVNPLTSNIKELAKITAELKLKKKV